jgi:hypothetical protein
MSLIVDRAIDLKDWMAKTVPVLYEAEDALKGCRDAIQGMHGRRTSTLVRALRRAEKAIEALEALRAHADQ